MTFDFQPTLQGELIAIRPLKADDFDDLYAVAADPLLWAQHPASERYQEPVFRDLFAESLASGGAVVVTDAATGKIIGSSRYHGFSEEIGEVEIGWSFLGRAYWGGVYNRELKRLMLEHAFRFVRRVVFLVGLQNIRSQRAMEKIGGVRIGERQNAVGRDSIVYEITAEVFETSPFWKRTS